MATKPKAILSTMDNREASPITKASNVLFENGQTAQDILNDRQDTMISPVIENSSSMFKVGQGDNVDYSANVVNGAYESMVLKGKSMVNCIQEPSSQDVVLPYEFEDGQYVTINDTKESGALGVELKGQTLVNSVLFIDKTLPYTWVSNNIASRTCALRGTFKTGVYALIVEFGEVLLGGVQSSQGISSAIQVNYTDGTSNSYTRSGLENYSKKRFFTTFTINKEVASIEFKGVATQYENVTTEGYVSPTVTVNKIMVLEYQDGMENWDIPYFEGMASCKMPSLSTVGKNLFNINGYSTKNQYASINGNTITVNAPTTFSNTVYTLTGLKEGELYRVSLDKTGAGEFSIRDTNASSLLYVEKEEGHVSRTFRYEKGATIRIGNRQIVNSEVSFANIQIEHGSTETAHESYKSSILSLPEEVVLRSLPNGVCDTFNTRTGVYTQRIGELILDGSLDEYWTDYKKELDTTQAFYASYNIIGKCYDIISNSFPTITKGKIQTSDIEGISTDESNERGFVFIRIKKSRLSTQDTDGFKAWLQSNPVTVQYQLETPIVTKINLSSTLKSWNTTTHVYSEIPEDSLYPTLSHSNPTYPVILKPSTKYSIVANSYSNSHTNSAINFNLGDATATTTVGNRVTTITTPSTLTSEELVMSGRGNKLSHVMVIEGDVVGDEPYFEGICDCKSPILSNVGKNLCDLTHLLTLSKEPVTLTGGSMGSTTYSEIEQNSIICTTQHANWWQYNIYKMKVKPSTTYHVSCTKEVVTQPTNGANRRHRIYIMNSESKMTSVTDGYKTTTLGDGIMYFVIADESDNGGGVGTQSKFTNVQIVEGEAKTTHEPYKSNILSVNGDKIELTENMFEQGSLYYDNDTFEQAKSFADDDSSTRSIRIRTKKLIKVKPNTTYRFSYKNSCQSWFYGYDMNENPTNSKSTVVGATEQVFTTNASTHYIALVLFKTGNPTITPSNYDYKSIQIAEVDKTIVLRSLPNGVCDTLNVETGEYVQRIGEVVLDGSDVSYISLSEENNYRTSTSCSVLTAKNSAYKPTNSFYCDALPTYHHSLALWNVKNKEYGISIVSEAWGFCVRLPHTLTGVTMSDNGSAIKQKFKEYLRSNPVIVQCELTTPIVTTIDVQGFPYAYTNGHVQLSSGAIEQSLTPKVEYSVATNRNGQIRSNQKMVERHQKQLDQLQAIILANLVNSQYNQTLTTLKYELSRV